MKLKDAIHHEFSCIQPEMLYAAVNNVTTHLQIVISGDGKHTE